MRKILTISKDSPKTLVSYEPGSITVFINKPTHLFADNFENNLSVITFADLTIQEEKPYSFTHLNFYLKCQLKSDCNATGLKKDHSTS